MGKVSFGKGSPRKVNKIKALSENSIVIQEKIVEVPVDRIVEKIVEVEKFINVPVVTEKIIEVEKKMACFCKEDKSNLENQIKNNKMVFEGRAEELNDLYEGLLSEQNSIKQKIANLDMDIDSVYKMHDTKMNDFENKMKKEENKNKLYLLIMGGLIILSLIL